MSETKLATKDDLQEMYQRILPYLGGMPEVLANKFSKGDLYDTTEKMIGKWIDGKPLYQIVIRKHINSFSDTSRHWITLLESNELPANIDKCYMQQAYWNENRGANYPIVDTNSFCFLADAYYDSDDNTLKALTYGNHWVQSSESGSDWLFILRYTKTTDQANSFNIGSDTDYSTDEKVVGTWIDSKPIYQKTLTVAMSGGTTEGILYWKQIDVSSLNIDCYVSMQAVLKGTNICMTIPSFEYVNGLGRAYFVFGWANNQINIHIHENNSTLLNNIKNSNAYITIQYTKTTS